MKRSKEEKNAYYRKYYNDNIDRMRKAALAKHNARQERKATRPRPDACELCGAVGKVVYDHDHDTGLFRGWLCHRCNLLLGLDREERRINHENDKICSLSFGPA